MVRDGDAMGIGRQIAEDLLGATKGRLDVGELLGFAGLGQEQVESGLVRDDVGRDNEGAIRVGLTDAIGKESLEASRERRGGQKEGDLPDADPAAAIAREAASGNDAVDMEMIEQVLAPGMENGHEAQPGAKLRVAPTSTRACPAALRRMA